MKPKNDLEYLKNNVAVIYSMSQQMTKMDSKLERLQKTLESLKIIWEK